MSDLLARYGPQPHDPSPLKRQCRLLQSWYRVELAKQPQCGSWNVNESPDGGSSVGSSRVGGQLSGANFISPAAFAYAKEKVAQKQTNPDLTCYLDFAQIAHLLPNR